MLGSEFHEFTFNIYWPLDARDITLGSHKLKVVVLPAKSEILGAFVHEHTIFEEVWVHQEAEDGYLYLGCVLDLASFSQVFGAF